MKVIFLDFDGVINNWNHFDGVDINNVKILKEILLKEKAYIVATTSNKYSFQRENGIDYYSSNYYNNYVKYLNELAVEIYDITPYVKENKTLEIKEYIKKHNIKHYVIIDDELLSPVLQDHQVLIELYTGLQEKHIEPVLKILNNQLGFYPADYNKDETQEEMLIRINNYYNSQTNSNYVKRKK